MPATRPAGPPQRHSTRTRPTHHRQHLAALGHGVARRQPIRVELRGRRAASFRKSSVMASIVSRGLSLVASGGARAAARARVLPRAMGRAVAVYGVSAAARAGWGARVVAAGAMGLGCAAAAVATKGHAAPPGELSRLDANHDMPDRYPPAAAYEAARKLSVMLEDEDPAALWRVARAAYDLAGAFVCGAV